MPKPIGFWFEAGESGLKISLSTLPTTRPDKTTQVTVGPVKVEMFRTTSVRLGPLASNIDGDTETQYGLHLSCRPKKS